DAYSAATPKSASPHRSKTTKAAHQKHGTASKAKQAERAAGPRIPLQSDQSPAPAPQLSRDLLATKQAIELVRHRKFGEATTFAASINDPAARKLIEWALLRSPDNNIEFERYAASIEANPDWPSIPLRRFAEARLWQDRHDAATVRRFLGGQPVTPLG